MVVVGITAGRVQAEHALAFRRSSSPTPTTAGSEWFVSLVAGPEGW
jgi:hypothetical protein